METHRFLCSAAPNAYRLAEAVCPPHTFRTAPFAALVAKAA